VTPGVHRVRFSRDGYDDFESEIAADATHESSVVCRMVPKANLPSDSRAEIHLRVSEQDAKVLVDGVPLTGPVLPAGRHHLEVVRAGFQGWTSDVDLAPRRATELSVQLQPEPEYAHELADRARARRTWAYVVGGTGVALGATAVALALRSSAEYDAWSHERDQIAQAPTAADYVAQLRRVQEKAMTVQRLDDWAIATGVVGGVLVASGAVLFLTSGPTRSALAPSLSTNAVGLSWNGSW
jgi:hypothetical protein